MREITILLVEDIDTDVKILMRAFDRGNFPCKVIKVSEGQEALDFLSGENDKPDIILLDVKMSGMDGHTFVREVKMLEDAKDIPIIVFTTQKDQEELFVMEGVEDFIVKTIDAKNLIERIKFILKRNG